MRIKTADILRKNVKDLPAHLAAAKAAVAQSHNHGGDTGAGVSACLDAPDTGGAASSSGDALAVVRKDRNVEFTRLRPVIPRGWAKTLNADAADEYSRVLVDWGDKDTKELRARYYNVSGQRAPAYTPDPTLIKWIAYIKVANNM